PAPGHLTDGQAEGGYSVVYFGRALTPLARKIMLNVILEYKPVWTNISPPFPTNYHLCCSFDALL
ncbi:MAG: hypothetical protein ACOYNO_02405, partial [Saprospiraceae bacterium]